LDTPAPDARATRGLVAAATLCAVVVLASQLAGKAARDAIFLQRFAVTNLPLLLAVSSALSIGFTIMFARRLRRGIPVRVVQLANVISAVLMIVEWQLLPYFPRPVALVVFMHQTLLGPILVSGFWSVVSECFDPRTARRVLGTIGTGATIGAIIGAVLAERVAAMFGTDMLLPTIAALELLATWRLARVGRDCQVPSEEDAPVLRDAIKNITKVSLLRRLAIVTVIVTISAALLDYVFKAMATEVVKRPDDLARLFALFHGVVGILTALVQWLLGKWALQHLGLARTLASLPGAVIAFGIAAIIAPGIGTYVALRGAENVLRNSLYREAYEVFYTPLLAAERRATKTIIDVGVERFGDVLGGLAVLAIIALAPYATTMLLVSAIVLSAIGVIVALQAQHSYVEALERSLLAHSIDFADEEPRDRTTRATLDLVRSSGGFRAQTDAPPKPSRWPRFRARQKAAKPSVDNAMHLLGELASKDPKRIRPALEASPLSPSGIAFAITLLDRPDLREAAMRAISRVATSCIGQLTDAVRDGQLSAAIRAQLPTVVVAAASDRARAELARAGLVAGLSDPEIDVRCAIAEALATLREVHPEISIDDEMVFAGVRRELAHAQHTPQTLKHLATLLALALPSEPIQMAFLGLKSEDPTLRGVSLEYLENVLPTDIREQMWTALAIEVPEAATTARRPLEDVLAELLRSRRDEQTLHATQVDLPRARATRRD
jgi:AAA family ATP:ADP antiporter